MDCAKMLSVQELEREAQEFVTKVQFRAERCEREMGTLIQTQKRELNGLQHQRDASWQRVQLLETHVKDSSQKKEDFQMERQFLEAEKSRKEGEQASLQRQLDAINEEVHETQHAFETNQRSLEERRRVLESRQSKLLETLNKYSSVLGLKFERSGNTMEFTFMNICEWDPKREFKVLLALDGNQNYQVVQSIPHLDSLGQLEMQLVQSNDLKKFVISIRYAFKAQTKLS